MRRHGLAIIELAMVGVLAIIVLVWAHPAGRDGSVLNQGWNGLSDACSALDGRPLYSYDELDVVKLPATLVVIPRVMVDTADVQVMGEFVEAGGTMILLDDFGFGNEVLAGLGAKLRFAGAPIMDPLFCYRDAAIPRVECLGIGGEGKPDELVLDFGTWMESVENTDVWARSSFFSYGDVDGDGRQDAGEPDGPFPVGVVFFLGDGEVVVISDSSVLLNGVISIGANAEVVQEFVHGEVMFDQVYLPDDDVDSSKASLNRMSGGVGSVGGAMVVVLGLCSLAVAYAWYNRERQEND